MSYVKCFANHGIFLDFFQRLVGYLFHVCKFCQCQYMCCIIFVFVMSFCQFRSLDMCFTNISVGIPHCSNHQAFINVCGSHLLWTGVLFNLAYLCTSSSTFNSIHIIAFIVLTAVIYSLILLRNITFDVQWLCTFIFVDIHVSLLYNTAGEHVSSIQLCSYISFPVLHIHFIDCVHQKIHITFLK